MGREIKKFKDMFKGTKEESLNEGENRHTNYMFFKNLETIKRCIEEIMEMDQDAIDELLTNGHDWANDHMSTSKDDVEEVTTFIKNEIGSKPKNDKVDYDSLSDKSKENADWEIEQRNKVSDHKGLGGTSITKDNSLFYTNGVWADFK